jgi:hypothetical protein
MPNREPQVIMCPLGRCLIAEIRPLAIASWSRFGDASLSIRLTTGVGITASKTNAVHKLLRVIGKRGSPRESL